MLSDIHLMSGSRTEWNIWVVLGKFSRGKGAVRIPKALFLPYCAKAPLIQFTRSDPLIACPKLKRFQMGGC